MTSFNGALAVALVGAIAAPPPAAPGAQEGALLTSDDLNRALAQRASDAEAARQKVFLLLSQPEVAALADKIGVDLRRAECALYTLEDHELRALASGAHEFQEELLGGQPPRMGPGGSRVALLVTLAVVLLFLILLATSDFAG